MDPTPKKVFPRYIYPDRLREGSIKRKVTADKYEPDDKRHCGHCYNTNLIPVDQIKCAVASLTSSSCDQCGVLWADIKHDRVGHADMHLKNSVLAVGINMNARDKANRYYDRNLKEKAYGLYYAEKLKSEEQLVSKFSRLSEKDQRKYLLAAESLALDEMDLLAGTVFEDNLTDDRPPINLSYVPFFVFPRDSSTYHFNKMTDTFGRYSYIARSLNDEITPHMTYQVDIPVTAANWGSDQIESDYVCYICTDPLDIDYSAEDGPCLIEGKVCTCSAHAEQSFPEQETPPKYVPPPLEQLVNVLQIVNMPIVYETPPQTALRYKDNIKFLFQCNSAFAGYVIHSKCCEVPTKKM